MQYKTLIVDGGYLAHRSYQAPYKLTTRRGLDATLIHSFIRSLNAIYKKFKPLQILVAWESPGTPSWRRELYPSYKHQRTIDIQYVAELEDLQVLLQLLNIKQFYAPNNEADDVMARLSIDFNHIDYPLIIFTVDKDIMQLVGEQCMIYDGKTMYDINKVKEKFFVWPEQIPDLLAIAGDKSDCIQGLNGYGFKKTAKLLDTYKDLEAIPSDIIPKDMLLLNKKLTKLNFDCSIKKLIIESRESIESILDKYELVKMKEKIEEYKLMGDK